MAFKLVFFITATVVLTFCEARPNDLMCLCPTDVHEKNALFKFLGSDDVINQEILPGVISPLAVPICDECNEIPPIEFDRKKRSEKSEDINKSIEEEIPEVVEPETKIELKREVPSLRNGCPTDYVRFRISGKSLCRYIYADME